jgi:multidrug efflux pump subunit AcrB
VVVASGLWLAPSVKTEFFPETDEAVVSIQVRTQLGSSLGATAAVCGRVEGLIQAEVAPEELLAIITSVGNTNTSNEARLFVRLRPAQERRRSVAEICAGLRKALVDKIPGIRISVNPGDYARRILNFGAQAPIEVQILGHDQEVGSRLATEVQRVVRQVPGAVDVQILPQGEMPSFEIDIDRDRIALLNLTPSQVAQTINIAIAGGFSTSNRFVDPESGNEFSLITQLGEDYRNHPEDLGSVPIAALFSNLNLRPAPGQPAGTPVLLRDIADIKLSSAPLLILRKNQERVISVTANNAAPLGEVTERIQTALNALEMPSGFQLYVAGQSEQQARAFGGLVVATGLALLLVFVVMACQFGSWWEPLLVMVTVPLGLVGVVWAQVLSGTSFSVMSFMGVIMMTGIVVSNGILLVETARSRRSQGLVPAEAIVVAARSRLRPILMTAVATLAGLVPMATGWGGGSDTNMPLARAVLGGLSLSTLLTLVAVPSFYRLLARHKAD